MCTRPFVKSLAAFACGQCLPCRINRRRLWSSRLQLEAVKHADACFVTLTYDKEHHPADGSLQPDHLRDWLKRLRFALAPRRVRFYAVGEYGDQTWRPHYHAVLFGVSPMEQELLRSTWKQGHILALPLTPQSCSYVAGYVTKKMTKKGDTRLQGREPEFARMSLRPGIGAHSMDDVARALNTPAGAAAVARLGDVPTTLRYGRSSMPLGRYLSNRLRQAYGQTIAPCETPAARLRALEMHQLRETVGRASFYTCSPMVEWQKALQVEKRHNIRNSTRHL